MVSVKVLNSRTGFIEYFLYIYTFCLIVLFGIWARYSEKTGAFEIPKSLAVCYENLFDLNFSPYLQKLLTIGIYRSFLNVNWRLRPFTIEFSGQNRRSDHLHRICGHTCKKMSQVNSFFEICTGFVKCRNTLTLWRDSPIRIWVCQTLNKNNHTELKHPIFRSYTLSVVSSSRMLAYPVLSLWVSF